jgi:hypothetical protein
MNRRVRTWKRREEREEEKRNSGKEKGRYRKRDLISSNFGAFFAAKAAEMNISLSRFV